MLIAVLIFSIINFIGLLIAGKIYFDNTFVIKYMDEWNILANVFNKAMELGYIDDNNEFIPPCELPAEELAGGEGFFKEYIDDISYEEEQQEDE